MATLWVTPGSWFSNAIVNGVLAGTARQSVENLMSLAITRSAVQVGAHEGDGAVDDCGADTEGAEPALGAPRQPAMHARSSNPAARTLARTPSFCRIRTSGWCPTAPASDSPPPWPSS